LQKRVVSGIVGLALLVIMMISHQIVLGISFFVFSLIGISEFYNSLSGLGYRPIKFIGFTSCLPVLLIGLNGVVNWIDNYVDLFASLVYFSMAVYIIFIVLLSYLIFRNKKYNIVDISLTIYGVLYIPFLMSFVVLTRNLTHGFYYVWFIFIGAWVTDTFAYFTGVLFGNRKIIPDISPKKTVEGTIGGVVGCAVITVIYGLWINTKLMNAIPVSHLVILGVINGIISQLGDWLASAIKRHTKIKDFGKIMPGHGGILDRFDSILLIGPVVYFYFRAFF